MRASNLDLSCTEEETNHYILYESVRCLSSLTIGNLYDVSHTIIEYLIFYINVFDAVRKFNFEKKHQPFLTRAQRKIRGIRTQKKPLLLYSRKTRETVNSFAYVVNTSSLRRRRVN